MSNLATMVLAFFYIPNTPGLLHRLGLAPPWVYGQEYCTIPGFCKQGRCSGLWWLVFQSSAASLPVDRSLYQRVVSLFGK